MSKRERGAANAGWFWLHNDILDYFAAQIGTTAICVLCVLARHAENDTREAYPSVKLIASKLRVSVNSVHRALKKLAENGLIVKQSRFQSNGRGQTSNLYRLLTPCQTRQGEGLPIKAGPLSQIEHGSPAKSESRTIPKKQNPNEQLIGALNVSYWDETQKDELWRRAWKIFSALPPKVSPVRGESDQAKRDRLLVLQVAALWQVGELSDNDIEQVLESFQAKPAAGERINNHFRWLRKCLTNRVSKLEALLSTVKIPRDFVDGRLT